MSEKTSFSRKERAQLFTARESILALAAETAYGNLKKLQLPSGLMVAAPQPDTGYNKAWFRDNIYEAIGLEAYGDWDGVYRVYRSLFSILRKHLHKIEWATRNRPTEEWQYIHARYHPELLNEYWENWGNAQNDMIGLFLFKVHDLAVKGHEVHAGNEDLLSLLVAYLQGTRYWEDRDNGMWEENREIHSSSVGNCVAGLLGIREIIQVPDWLIQHGQYTLDFLLPRESETKNVDLAQLSLIWPCHVTSPAQTKQIIENVGTQLLRSRGVIRYHGDYYYNARKSADAPKEGNEAEWTMGLPWLALVSEDQEKREFYIQRTLAVRTEEGHLPELYSGGTPNGNTPLGWAEAMLLCALA